MSTGFATFIEQELKAERDRRSMLDSRGQSVVTMSGVLVTLLVAVGSLAAGNDGFDLEAATVPLLGTTVGLFALSSFFGILVTINFRYQVASKKTLQDLPLRHWTVDETVATKNIAWTNVTTILTLRAGNDTKVTLLLVALFTQLAALASLAATIYSAVRLG